MIGFITGMPRSRTHWFAEYFSHYCPAYHEPLNGIKSKKEFYKLVDGGCIVSDSGLFITDFESRWNVPTLVIDRPLIDVQNSLNNYFERQGLEKPSGELLARQYAEVKKIKGKRVNFSDINEKLKEITNFFGFDYDEDYSNKFMAVNSQVKELKADAQSYLLWDKFKTLVGG